MVAHHPNLSENEYFVAAAAPPPDIQIKTEVTEEEFIVAPSLVFQIYQVVCIEICMLCIIIYLAFYVTESFIRMLTNF